MYCVWLRAYCWGRITAHSALGQRWAMEALSIQYCTLTLNMQPDLELAGSIYKPQAQSLFSMSFTRVSDFDVDNWGEGINDTHLFPQLEDYSFICNKRFCRNIGPRGLGKLSSLPSPSSSNTSTTLSYFCHSRNCKYNICKMESVCLMTCGEHSKRGSWP